MDVSQDAFLLSDISSENIFSKSEEVQANTFHLPHIKFRRARSKQYFDIGQNQEMNSAPYKYNIVLENIDAEQQHYIGLYVIDEKQNKIEYVPDGIAVERIVRKTTCLVELRIAFNVYSYAFGNCNFLVMLFDSNNTLLAETKSFVLLARKNRKRTMKKSKKTV